MSRNRARRPHRPTLPALLPALLLAGLLAAPPGSPPAGAQEPVAAEAEAQAAAVRGAVERLEAGDLSGAVELLEPLARLEGVDPRLHALLGALYLELGRAAEAMALLGPPAAAPEADAAVLYNAGRAALALGREGEAEGYLERSVALEAGTPAARELGLLRGRQGRTRDAYRLLAPWARANADDLEARLAAAVGALRLRRAPEAEALLSDLPQDLPRVRLLWGQLLVLKWEHHGAVATLRPLLAEAPEEMEQDVRRALAEAYLGVGRAAEAVELLDGRVGGDPGNAVHLALARYQAGDLEGALETLHPFAAALAAEGEQEGAAPGSELNARIARDYGRFLVAAGRHAEALPFLQAAAAWDAGDRRVWQALAQALTATGQREEAERAVARFRDIAEAEGGMAARDRQIEQDSADPTGREIRRALDLLRRERAAEALAVLRAELELAPADPRLHLLASRTLLLLERLQEALEAAARGVALAPEDPDARYQRGVARMAGGDGQGAEEDLRAALALAPGHTAAMSDLAVLLAATGRRQEARELLERVVALRPDDEVAQENLRRLSEP